MFPDGFDAGVFDGGVFDTASAAVAASVQSGAHGRKRSSDLAAFLATVEEHKETPDERDEPTPRKRAPIRLPAAAFRALPERFQLPVMESFADTLSRVKDERIAEAQARRIEADRARRLQAAIREAIRLVQEEDDEDVILALAA